MQERFDIASIFALLSAKKANKNKTLNTEEPNGMESVFSTVSLRLSTLQAP